MGKPMYSGKKLSQGYFVHHKSHMDWPGIEPGPPKSQFTYLAEHFLRKLFILIRTLYSSCYSVFTTNNVAQCKWILSTKISWPIRFYEQLFVNYRLDTFYANAICLYNTVSQDRIRSPAESGSARNAVRRHLYRWNILFNALWPPD
jgi:hypothetical protein